MNVLAKKLLKVIIPVTIGTIIFVGCFWISDRLDPNTDMLICEDPSLSNTSYLLGMGMLAAIGILYQLTVAKLLRDIIQTSEIPAFAIEVTGFVVCFATFSNLFGKSDNFGDQLLSGLILGSVYSVSMLLFKRLIK